MKRKLILGSCVCIVITIFNFANMLNVDDLKLELLFDKIEALAAGETLPPIDVICSNAGWGRCWAIDTDHFPQASNAILQETNHIFVQNPFN